MRNLIWTNTNKENGTYSKDMFSFLCHDQILETEQKKNKKTHRRKLLYP